MDGKEQHNQGHSTARTLGIKTARSGLTYAIGQVVGSLLVLVMLVMLARLLTASNFGIYAIAIAFYTILSVCGNFGMGTALRKSIPPVMSDKKRISEMISSGYAVALSIALAVAIIGALSSGFIAKSIYHNPSISGLLMFASLLVFLYVLFNLTLAILIALDKVKHGTFVYIAYALAQLLAAATLVILGYGVLGALAGLAIGLAVPALIGIAIIYRSAGFSKPSRKTIKELTGFSVPIVISNIAIQGPPNLAILLLGVYTTAAIVGNYNAAYRLGNFVSIFFVANSFILLPAFSKAFSDDNLRAKIGKIFNQSIYYTLLFFFPLLIFGVSVSQPLFTALFSGKYAMAPLYFAVIALGTTVTIISNYSGNLIVSYGNTKSFMKYQLAAVLIQVALLGALTPFLKATGILLSLFIVSPFIIDIMYINALKRQFSLKQEYGQMLRLAIPSVVLLALLTFASIAMHQSIWMIPLNLAATILLFPPLAVLTGGIRKENLEFIRDLSGTVRMKKAADVLVRYATLFMRTESHQTAHHPK